MKAKKSLVSAIVLSTGILFGGCSEKITCYDLPNEEKVCIKEVTGNDSMIITKTDGRVIEIVYNSILDSETPGVTQVKITKDKETKEYRNSEIITEATKMLTDYYKRTTRNEVEKGLKDLQ